MGILGAPRYVLRINDILLREDVTGYINNIKYTMAERAADILMITLDNPGNRFGLNKLFSVGNDVKVYMGYGENVSLLGQCRIKRKQGKFSEEGSQQLIIKALGGETILAVPPDSNAAKRYEGMSADEFASAVAANFNMSSDVQFTAKKQDIFITSEKTYKQIFQELAKQLSYEFYVRFDEDSNSYMLHFHPARQEKKYKFEWGAGERTTLYSFEPTEDAESQITELEVVAWDHRNGTPIIVKVEQKEKGKAAEITVRKGDPNMKLEEGVLDGSAVRLAIAGKTKLTELVDINTVEDLKRYAEAKFKEHQESFIVGQGRGLGVETLLPGQTHTLAGIGEYSGDYYFTQIDHEFGDGGYSTSFTGYKTLEL